MVVSLKLRRRLRTIKNLNSIFNALQVITTARLQKIKERHRHAQHFLGSVQEMSQDFDFSKFNKTVKNGKALALLISPNRGFCGAFNANLFFRAQNFIKETGREVEFVAFGRKGLEFLKAKKQYVSGSYLAEDYSFPFFVEILNQILRRWEQNEIAETYLIFNRFYTEGHLPMDRTEKPAFSKSLTIGSNSSVPMRMAATLFPSTMKEGRTMLMTFTLCFLNTSRAPSNAPGLSSRAMVKRVPFSSRPNMSTRWSSASVSVKIP